MFVKVMSFVLVLGLLAACSLTSSSVSDSLTKGKSPTKLQMINGANFYEVVSGPKLPGLDKAKEDQIRDQCGAPEEPPEFAFIPIAFLIGPSIDFILDQIDKALEEELKKYVAAYSGSVDGKFYKSTGSTGPAAAWTCFRFSRGVGPKDEETVVMDLIGQIALTEGKDALKVRPLRLYFAQAKAKGEKIGVSVSIEANSVWRQNNIGRNEKIFEQKLLTEKIDISDGKVGVRYYLDKDFDKYPRIPLLPWSTNKGADEGGGDTTFTLTVAEVGTPPKLLEIAVKLFKKKKGDLAKLMKDSAEKLLSEN